MKLRTNAKILGKKYPIKYETVRKNKQTKTYVFVKIDKDWEQLRTKEGFISWGLAKSKFRKREFNQLEWYLVLMLRIINIISVPEFSILRIKFSKKKSILGV